MKYLSLLLLTLVSCYTDVKNIEIKGQILDNQLKRPISHSSITIICWSYGNTPDGSYTKQDSLNVTSDSKGNYRGDFEKGAYIEIKTSARDYHDDYEAFDITTSKNDIDIYMERKKRIRYTESPDLTNF